VTPVTKNPSVGPTDLEQDKIVIEPNPTDTGRPKHQAMGGSNVNQWHGRTGVFDALSRSPASSETDASGSAGRFPPFSVAN
jgi:hypothetical protein